MPETPEDNAVGRGIEGIAHLFLSGLSGNSAPVKRQGPSSSPPTVLETPPVPSTAQVALPQKWVRTIFLSDHLDRTGIAIHSLAQTMVQERGPLALLDLTDSQTILASHFTSGRGTHQELGLLDESIDSAWQELFGNKPDHSSPREQTLELFSTRLTQLRKQVNSLLIHLPHQMDSQEEALLQQCDQIVLLCGASQEQLLKTYQLLKRLSPAAGSVPISIFFYGQQEEQERYIEVFEKLAKAANEFLELQIEWAERDPTTESIIQSDIETTQRSDAAMECVHHFLHPAIQEPRKKDKAIPSTPFDTWSPLILSDLPDSDAALTQALAQTPESWLKSLPTPEYFSLPLPDDVDERACVLVDATGRLHLLFASLGTAEGLLATALHARQWFSQNIRLIQGYGQDRSIDSELAIGLILVGATPGEKNNEWTNQFGFPCQTLQAYLLANESIKGLLVV